MQTICIKTKLKKGTADEVRDWFSILRKRISEVKETLKNEGVVVESAFLDHHGGDSFLIYYVKAENINRVYDIFEKSNLPIDDYFKECWKKYCEGREVLEELLDVDRIMSIMPD
jgi:hypothetical protein